MRTVELNARVALRWTSISSRAEYKYFYSSFMHVTGTGISSGLMGHLTRIETLQFPRKLLFHQITVEDVTVKSKLSAELRNILCLFY